MSDSWRKPPNIWHESLRSLAVILIVVSVSALVVVLFGLAFHVVHGKAP